MNQEESPTSISLNAREMGTRELDEAMGSAASSMESIEINDCEALDFLAAGFTRNCRVSIQGELGDYCLCNVSNAEVEVRGRAGLGLGASMESGAIILFGDAGDSVGAFNRGGLIAIHGNAGRRAAGGMCGGDIVVHGSIGAQGAFAMVEGNLLVFGKAGAMLGQDMTGGTIYVAGEVESMAPHIEVVRLRESDRLRIGLLLLKSGLNGDARNFRVLKVAGT